MTDTPAAAIYLTIAQAADALSCSPDSVRRLIARGELRAYRFGRLIRISPTDIQRAGRPITRLRPHAADPSDPVPSSESVPSGRRPEETWKEWALRRQSAG